MRNNFSVVALRFISLGALYLTHVLLSNKLGTENYGYFNTFLAFSTVLSVMVSFGMNEYLLRINSEKKKQHELRKVYVIMIVGVIFYSFFLSILITELLSPYFFLIVFLSFSLALLIIQGAVFQSMQMPLRSIFFQFLLPLIFTLAMLIIDNRSTIDLNDFLMFYLIFHILTNVIALILIHKESMRKEVTEYKVILRDSLNYFLVNTLTTLQSWIDILLISVLLSAIDVAEYSVASRITLLLSMILIALNAVYKHHIAENFKSNKEALKEKLADMSKSCIFFSIPLAFILLLLQPILVGMFGIEPSKIYIIYAILLSGNLFNVIMGPLGPILLMSNNEDALLKINIKTLVIRLIFTIIMAYYLGVIGVALASLISLVYWNVSASLIVRRLIGYYPVYGLIK